MIGRVRFLVDPSSSVPLSVQLRDRLVEEIEQGRLEPGERLPPVRELAASLGIAPNTVAKAYRELEGIGLLVARGRLGTFVTEALPTPPTEFARRLAEAAESYARRARQLGASEEETVSALRGVLDR